MSWGEKFFNLGVYGGIQGVGVFLATIPITYFIKYGKGPITGKFRDGYKWLVSQLKRTGLSAGNSEHVVMTLALMQGGNLGLIPVKLAENHKPEIVGRLNEILGEKNDSEAVRKEPDQTWGSLIKSRLVAFGLVLGSFWTVEMLADKRLKQFKNFFARGVTTLSGKASFTNFRIGKIAALDIFATAAATTLLFIASRFFAVADKAEPEKAPTPPPPVPYEPQPSVEGARPLARDITPASSHREMVAQQRADASTTPSLI